MKARRGLPRISVPEATAAQGKGADGVICLAYVYVLAAATKFVNIDQTSNLPLSGNCAIPTSFLILAYETERDDY